jgi:hypothetical protein
MNASLIRGSLTIVSAAIVAMLAACGDGSDPAAVSAARNDEAAVRWNTAATIDVTANDTAHNGTTTVAIASAPTHGTATIDGTKIRYTPAAGFFGEDTLTYTLSVGDQTSTASLHVAVEAHMTFKGTVHDDALPGAQVVITVGGTAQAPVTADAEGNYVVDVVTSDPHAFITLQATGAGAQSNVVLSSLVGDADAAAAAAASETGVVEAAALPATNVTHVSTAAAVLATQALGKAPASSADIAAAQGSFTAAQTIEVAAAIKLVADLGVALPEGVKDTLALVTDKDAYAGFVATQVSTNNETFQQAQSEVLADPAIAVRPPVPVEGAADIDLLVTLGQGAAANSATRLVLKADGTAVVVGAGRRTAKWTTEGTQIRVTYDQPITTRVYENSAVDHIQYAISKTSTGLKLRQLGGAPGAGPASVDYIISSFKWLEGPKAGQTSAGGDEWVAETMVAKTQAFVATDFTAGTEWAGVLAPDFAAQPDSVMNQDTLKVVDDTHVLFERTGTKGTYALVDGRLVVTTSAGVFSYTRMFTGPRGEERWLAQKLVDGASQWAYDAAVVKVTGGLKFTAANVAHDWQSYINVGLATSQFFIQLHADGTGSPASADMPGTTPVPTGNGTWTINADGSETFTRSFCEDGTLACGRGQVRTWALLATEGRNIYVMEHLVNMGTLDQYRINVYTNAD